MTLFVRELGTGPAVLLLHGTPSPAADWLPLAERLAARHRVLIPDLPGYGRSAPLADAAVERVGDAIGAMLAERGHQDLHAIVGYSSGAYRAFDLALRGHARPAGIVSLAGFASFDDEARGMRLDLSRRLAEDPAFLASAELAAVMPALMLSPARRTPELVAHIMAWLEATTAAALAGELAALAASRDLRPELPRLACPVYVRVGALDAGCPPSWSEEIADLTNGRLDIVPGCGHAILVEDRDATIGAIDLALRNFR